MDNEQLLTWMKENLATKTELSALREELIERIADAQTEVLRAFYNWGRPVDARIRAMEERQGSMDSRLLAAEEKILNLGRR